MDMSKWMQDALKRVENMKPSSKPFELKDLFTGDEWTKLSHGERTTFGRNFAEAIREAIRNENAKGIEFAPIKKAGQHIKYIKR